MIPKESDRTVMTAKRSAVLSVKTAGTVIAVLAAVLVFGLTGLADHGGPKVFVDVDNPTSEDQDCNFHFRTLEAALTQCELAENSVIVLDPGNYDEGQLTLDTKGLTIRSSEVAKRTQINGCLTVTAKNVQLENLEVSAEDCEAGVSVQDRFAKLESLLVHDAQTAGVRVTDASDGTEVTDLQIYNNGQYGLHVTGANLDLTVTDNSIVSNDDSGILLEGNADRFTISDNKVNTNGGAGLHILGGDNGQVTNNTFNDNGEDGLRLETATGHSVVDNTVDSNGQFGISIVKGGSNELRSNTLTSNALGGLVLRAEDGHVLNNTVENNEISSHSDRDASGVLLIGDVTGNIVLKNTVENNHVGVRFATGSENGAAPARNILDSNEITGSNSVGIRVEASAGLNRFTANTVVDNIEAGIYVSGGQGNDEYADNTIRNNGAEGIRVEGSSDNAITDNEINANGSNEDGNLQRAIAGVALVNAQATLVQANAIGTSESRGVLLKNTKNSRLLDNTIEDRSGNGVHGVGVVQPLFTGNAIQGNSGRGVKISSSDSTSCASLDFQRNDITGNSLGGMSISNCAGVHLQMNQIADNMRFGVWVEQSERIQARYNWWGDPSGPSGVFAGQGNAVIFQDNDVTGGNSTGLPDDQILQAVVPWLTDQVGEQTENSVNGYTLRDFGGPSVDLDATDFAGIRLSLHDVEPESKGVAILARYAQQMPSPSSIYAPVVLPSTMRTVSVVVSGFGAQGQAIVEMNYQDGDLPEDADESNMGLYVLYGGEWHALPGSTLADVNVVQGTVDLSRLQEGTLIAMAPKGDE